MPKTSLAVSAPSMTAHAFEQIRSDIITGVLKPNQRLRIEQLRSTYAIGITPLREALTRLTKLNLVILEDQRGFRVADVSEQDLQDVCLARQELEIFLLRQAIADSSRKWEEEIQKSFGELKRWAKAGAGSGAGSERWETAHRGFHFALIAQAGNRLMQSFHSTVWDLSFRYRVLMLPPEDTPVVMKEHKQIMEAALSRETDLAIALLRRHISIRSGRAINRLPELADPKGAP